MITWFGMSLIDPASLSQAKYIILNVKRTFNIENYKELLVWGKIGKRALRG